MAIEEDYLDVLQNIEAGILSVYRNNKQMLDYDAETAVNALVRDYQAEQKSGQPVQTALNDDLKRQLYSAVREMCEWRLGRSELVQDGKEVDLIEEDGLSLEEMIACLKRIRKSIQYWTKQEGRQGYLNFVSEFIP
jgi:hypothetical protein